jgi:DNA-binding GntR family transcriptional regulator
MSSRKVSGRDAAYSHLLQTVLTDPSNAGKFLSEQDIATDLGISRTPVREAMLLLNARGLIEMVPHRGAMVPALTNSQIRQLFSFRELIEVKAADLTIDAGAVPLDIMRSLLQQQEALRSESDLDSSKAFIALDGDFHLTMVKSTANEYMIEAYAGIRTRQLMVGTEAIFRLPNRREQVCTEHQGILDALADQDLAAAEAAIVEHLKTTRDILLLN